MAKVIVGVIVASVVLYLFGFVYWGMGPYGEVIWKHAANDEAAGAALVEHFPENGTYYVPAVNQDPESVERLFDKGPVAFVHMLAIDGRPQLDPSIMIGGFFLNLLAIIMIAALLKVAAPALPTYAARVGFVALAGAAATIFIEGNEVVWWQITWQWKVYQAVYDVVFWIIAGVILSAFIGTGTRDPAAPETVPG